VRSGVAALEAQQPEQVALQRAVGSDSTDVEQDFEVGNVTVVTAPAGAWYPLLSPIDDHVDDNSSFDLHVGVDRAP
jgi:hypothetical protein